MILGDCAHLHTLMASIEYPLRPCIPLRTLSMTDRHAIPEALREQHGDDVAQDAADGGADGNRYDGPEVEHLLRLLRSRAVRDDLDGLQRDEPLAHHLVERREKRADILFAVDDLDQDREDRLPARLDRPIARSRAEVPV